jgi:hypothetical protein
MEEIPDGLPPPWSAGGPSSSPGGSTTWRTGSARLWESPVTALIAAEDIRAAWETMALCDRKQVVDRLMTVRILPAGKGQRCTPEQVGIP